jgi:hypothetical protein
MSVTNGAITALPPPAGYVVDFENPQRQGDIVGYCVAGIGSLLALLFMGQGIYVKVFVRHVIGDVLRTVWLLRTQKPAADRHAIIGQFRYPSVGE